MRFCVLVAPPPPLLPSGPIQHLWPTSRAVDKNSPACLSMCLGSPWKSPACLISFCWCFCHVWFGTVSVHLSMSSIICALMLPVILHCLFHICFRNSYGEKNVFRLHSQNSHYSACSHFHALHLFFCVLQCHCVCFCLVTAHKICIFSSLLIYCFLVFGCKDNDWYTNSVLIESIVFLVILSICFLVYLMWKHSQTWVTNQYCKLIIVRLNNITILYNT